MWGLLLIWVSFADQNQNRRYQLLFIIHNTFWQRDNYGDICHIFTTPRSRISASARQASSAHPTSHQPGFTDTRPLETSLAETSQLLPASTMTSLGPELNVLLKIIDDLREKVLDVQRQQRQQETEMGALRAQVDALKTQIGALQHQQRKQSRSASNSGSFSSLGGGSIRRAPLSTKAQRAEWVRMGLCGRCSSAGHVVRTCPLQSFKLVEKVEGRPWNTAMNAGAFADDTRSHSDDVDSDTDDQRGGCVSIRLLKELSQS